MLAAKTFVHFNSLRKAHHSLLNSFFNSRQAELAKKNDTAYSLFFFLLIIHIADGLLF